MSTIRYLDVPHVVRYGHQDHERGESWMRFYRNATCFEVSINQTDIAGSPFEQEWRRCLTPPQDQMTWFSDWNSFCDCVISHILPKLEELAPTGLRSWTTLEDYLSTPMYKLSLHWSKEGSKDEDAVAMVDSGPAPVPAFELGTQSMTNLDLPPDLPFLQASELQVLDQAKDLRQQPHKVLMPNGTTAFLVPAASPMRASSGELLNQSIAQIESWLSLHRRFAGANISYEPLAGIPEVLAVVTTFSTMHTVPENNTPDASSMLLAGILLTYLPRARRLFDPSIVSLVAKSTSPDNVRRRWYVTLSKTLRALHDHFDIIHGSINPHTLLISRPLQKSSTSDENNLDVFEPYLVHFSHHFVNELYTDPANKDTAKADWEGLENTLGDRGWFAHEIKKMNGEIDEGSKWQRQTAA